MNLLIRLLKLIKTIRLFIRLLKLRHKISWEIVFNLPMARHVLKTALQTFKNFS